MSNKSSPTFSISSPTSVGLVELVLLDAKNIPVKNKSGDVYVRMKVGDGFFNWSRTSSTKASKLAWNFVSVLKVKNKQSKILHMRVNEANFFSPDDTLGECFLDLEGLAPDERHDMTLCLRPPGEEKEGKEKEGKEKDRDREGKEAKGKGVGELHFCVAYFPHGKISLPNIKDTVLSAQVLAQIPKIAPASPPILHRVPKSNDQIKAEQLYTRAMEELGKFVESAAHKGPKDAVAPTSLKLASQLLLESLKVYRLGKSFAMLAFIFYQFDSLELTSKYLTYAEQLEPSFPVIPRLRDLLVESGCRRDPLDATMPHDRLSIVVVEAKNLPLNTPSMQCRLVVGYSETIRETNFSSNHEVAEDGVRCTWREFFEVSLTKATERYQYGHQNLTLQFHTKVGNDLALVCECGPVNMFDLERDTIYERWLPMASISGSVRVILNYQMGHVTDEEALPLLYSAVYSRDETVERSLTKKRCLNLDKAFREYSSSNPVDKLEPDFSTVLTKASRFGNLRVMKQLIQLGASINAVDEEGFTPIMRAVQFSHMYDTLRSIKFLLSLGADLDVQNMSGYDVFSYCQTTEMCRFLQAGACNKVMYKVHVEFCSNCNFLHFPDHYGTERNDDEVHNCDKCSSPLKKTDKKEWIISKREMEYAKKAYHYNMPPVIDHYIVQCPYCKSFGFPGTRTKSSSSQLTTASDTAVIGTNHESDDLVEFALPLAQTMWYLPFHEDSCPLPSRYDLTRVQLARHEILGLLKLSPRLPFPDPCTKIRQGIVADPSSSSSSFSLLDQLPLEILECVLGYLGCDDVAVCEGVSRGMRGACDSQVWKLLVQRDFNLQNPLQRRPAATPAEAPVEMEEAKEETGDGKEAKEEMEEGEEKGEEEAEERMTWKETYLVLHPLCRWIKDLLLVESFHAVCSTKITPTESGAVDVTLSLLGKKYLFNLDGDAFSFDGKFSLSLTFPSIGKVSSIFITAPNQSISKILQLRARIPPSPKSVLPAVTELQEHDEANGKATIVLVLEELTRWINPYLTGKMIPGFHSFLTLKDGLGGSVILDFFYFSLSQIILQQNEK